MGAYVDERGWWRQCGYLGVQCYSGASGQSLFLQLRCLPAHAPLLPPSESVASALLSRPPASLPLPPKTLTLLPLNPPARQIIIGALVPDSGEIIKAKEDMRIAYLTQVGWGCCKGDGLLSGAAADMLSRQQ